MKPILQSTKLTALALLAVAGASTAQAAAILGAPVVVATTGNVTATFRGHTAGYTSTLFLDSPGGPIDIFVNHTNAVGDTFNLGTFTAGTELVFGIYVWNTGETFYSGDASRNPDGLPHNVVDNDVYPGETYVGFEDLLGGGDMDYDDNNFSFTNTRAGTVPEGGATLTLLAGALALTGAAARRFGRR